MRIELKYRSTCPSSKKLRAHLEDIIADERLPLVLELTESDEKDSPSVRIHAAGAKSDDSGGHEIKCDKNASSERQFLDSLRSVVLEKWHDHAIHPLSHLRQI